MATPSEDPPAASTEVDVPPAADVVTPSATLTEAWERWLASGAGVPRGLTPFLRTATVKEEDGVLVIAPLPGPALERLSDGPVLAEIGAGMAPFLGRTLSVRVQAPPEATPHPRISTDEVRADTLKSLYRKEPRLERAVEELDLELME